MPRQLIALALMAAGGAAHAQPAPAPDAPPPAPDAPPPASGPADPGAGPTSPASPPATGPAVTAPATEATEATDDDELGDQLISVALGAAGGGRATPGGLRIVGQYLYQLSDEDWFDGAASFTFGSSRGACFRDRQDHLVCSHGVADGTGVEISASVRRVFAARGAFRPYARIGVGLGLARFSDDDITGFTIPAHAGGGLRIAMSPTVAIIAEGDLALGFSSFSRGLGSQPQLGIAVTAGAEFRLR